MIPPPEQPGRGLGLRGAKPARTAANLVRNELI